MPRVKAEPKLKAKRSHHKQKRASKPLPPPLELPQQSQPELKPNGGLLGNLGNLFQSQPEPEASLQTEIFSMPSPAASAGSSPTDGPLSPEAEQILAQIPDHIGGEADDPGGPADMGELGGAAFGSEICDEAAVRETLVWIGEMLADWRKREDYRAAGKRASGAAKHWARVVNGAWAKWAPLFLASMGNAYPGLIPALAMTAVAFGPAVMADMKQSAKERKGGFVQAPRPQPVVEMHPAGEPKRAGFVD